jgi:hypothetical protein
MAISIDKTKPIARLGVAFAAKLIEQKFDKQSLKDLTDSEIADLNSMSEREIYNDILKWEGIMGYTDLFLTLHEQLWPAIANCNCPACGSNDIRKGDLNDVGSTIDVPSVCRNCGEELRLVYDLRRIDREL